MSESRHTGAGGCEVEFLPAARSVSVRAGARVMDAALLGGVFIDAPCGGEGGCGKCLVRARGSLAPPTDRERERVPAAMLDEGCRLACQAVVLGSCSVETGPHRGWADSKSGLAAGGPREVDLPGLPGGALPHLGAAVDVGTTTVCVSILDLRSGERLGIASDGNPQTRFGADVMTRIDRFRKDRDAAVRMHREVVGTVNSLLEAAASHAGARPSRVARLVMVGNTTMLHLALGADPSCLGCHPFEPVVRGPVRAPAEEFGLEAAPGAELLVPRVLSGFLGADIVAVILACGAADRDGPALMVDLGTNGEVALGGRRGMAACSTAAGPAFEGAEISCGMRAVPGAIESMSRDGRLAPGVLGGGRPLGICGSGLLDAVAALLENGLVNPQGRLAQPALADRGFPGRVRGPDSAREFVLAPGTGLSLTQGDIREFQLAKGAIRAGVDVLCERLGVDARRLEEVHLAGVFGSLMKPAAAIAVGLFPGELKDRVVFAGNAALDGAEMMLASEKHWMKALALAGSVEVVELSGDPEFERTFIQRLAFPG